MPLRPSQVSEKEINYTQVRVMANQIVHELIDAAHHISTATSKRSAAANAPVREEQQRTRQSRRTQRLQSSLPQNSPRSSYPSGAKLQMDNIVEFPPLRRQPPVFVQQSGQHEDNPVTRPAAPPIRVKHDEPTAQSPPTPSTVTHQTSESPPLRSNGMLPFDHAPPPFNLGAFALSGHLWGDWIHQELQYAGNHGVGATPYLVELTHSLLSSTSETQSNALRLYPDIQPLDEQARLPLSFAPDIYSRLPHLHDEEGHDSEAADVDDTDSASAQAPSLPVTEDHVTEEEPSEADMGYFALEELALIHSPDVSRPSTAATKMSSIGIKEQGSRDISEQRSVGSQDIFGRMSRSRSSSGVRTGPVAAGVFVGSDGINSDWDADGDATVASAASNEGTRKTRANSKPEYPMLSAAPESDMRFDRKRAESAENVGRPTRRHGSHVMEDAHDGMLRMATSLTSQAGPSHLLSTSNLVATKSDQDGVPRGPHRPSRFRRAFSETRVSNHAQGSGKAKGEQVAAASSGFLQERLFSDHGGPEIPDARTVFAVLTGACLR